MEHKTTVEDNKQLTGIKKRQQINKANKKMFVWVAIASVIITATIVIGQFMVRQAFFNQKVITEKSKTLDTLVKNKENATQLKTKVDELVADSNLAKVNSVNSGNNLQVIYDALPATSDAATFANSLATSVLPKSQVQVMVLTAGAPTGASAATVADTSSDAPQPLPFSATVSGSADQITQSLKDLEYVIRPISVQRLAIQASDQGQLTATIEGVTYYLNPTTISIEKKAVKP